MVKQISDLHELIQASASKKIPAKFENLAATPREILAKELTEFLGSDSDKALKIFKTHEMEIFNLILETIEDVLPRDIGPELSMFVEFMNIGWTDNLRFRVETGKQRAKQFLTMAAEAGIYRTFRLDSREFEVTTHAYGIGARLDYMRLLRGYEDIMSLYDALYEALQNGIFTLIQQVLMASWYDTRRPEANRVSLNTLNTAELDRLIAITSAYGDPVIFCTRQFAATLTNGMTFNTTSFLADGDLTDMRSQGFVGVFHGTPVVLLPQSFTDETNSKFSMNPRLAYIIPRGKERFIKIIKRGTTQIKELDHTSDWGVQIQAFASMGGAIVTAPNYWTMYQNTSIPAEGWDLLT